MKKTIIFGLIIVLATVLIDQITKALMVSILVEEGNFIVVIPEFFKLKLHYNTGAAFSSFDGNFPFLMIMTVVATIVFIYMAKYADFVKFTAPGFQRSQFFFSCEKIQPQ